LCWRRTPQLRGGGLRRSSEAGGTDV
jgi:hypothetical protein